MESATNFTNDQNTPPPFPFTNTNLKLETLDNEYFSIDNLVSPKNHVVLHEYFQNLDQTPLSVSSFNPYNIETQSDGFDPFDPFPHTDFGLYEFKPYEENGSTSISAAMHDLQGGGFFNFSDKKDSSVEIETSLKYDDDMMMPLSFLIPDESSCVSNVDNLEEDGRKRNKNVIKKCDRARKKAKSSKGQWTNEEDRLLIHLVEKHGVRKWSSIAQMLKGRIGKQCRERWHNHLRPDIKKDIWTEEEDRVLIETHAKVGNKWAEIAKSLPGRTENSIKNHWNATKRRQFSRRKCRTKWPKPSTLLQNYIKNLHVDKESNSTERTTNIDDHSRTFHNTSSSVSSPPRINPEIEFCKEYEFDDVTDFTFDSFMDDFDADELEFDVPLMCEVKKEVDFFDGIA
ncbi:hypothetical protein ABFS83_04G171900 [Erythranthe nasuta]